MARTLFSYVTRLLIVLLITSIIFSYVQASEISSQSAMWAFEDRSYLTFNQFTPSNVTVTLGKPYPTGLMGYWNLDSTQDYTVSDLFGNNGTVVGGKLADGKYGNSLSFNGIGDYVNITTVNLIVTNAVTIDLWVNFDSPMNGSSWIGIFGKKASWSPNVALGGAYNKIYFGITTTIGTKFIAIPEGELNTWQHIVATYDKDISSNNLKMYRNGELITEENFTGSVIPANDSWLMGKGQIFFNGSIDDIQLYNRGLTTEEVSKSNTLGNPANYVNYFNFCDTAKNSMLIGIVNLDSNIGNSALVTCTSFFLDNRLVFQTNSSVQLNIWTNRGKPMSNSGTWNAENNTLTLPLDSDSSVIAQWAPGVPPIASILGTDFTDAGNTSKFYALWTDNMSLTHGGYIYSTNNTGRWVNATWTPFNANPSWSNVSISLNSTIGLTIGFREFANNSQNIWADSGIYAITTTASYESKATPTPMPTATPNVTLPTATITPTPTMLPSTNPTTAPNTTPGGSQDPPLEDKPYVFPNELALALSAVFLTMLFATLVMASKKGYLKIEMVKEESGEL